VTVGLDGPHKIETEAAELMLEKLSGNLMNALVQMKSFIDQHQCMAISKTLVFLSGTSSWSMEWNDMWEALRDKDNKIWGKVKKIQLEASNIIKLPFELIVEQNEEEETIFGGEKAMKIIPEYKRFPFQSV